MKDGVRSSVVGRPLARKSAGRDSAIAAMWLGAADPGPPDPGLARAEKRAAALFTGHKQRTITGCHIPESCRPDASGTDAPGRS